MLVYLVMMGSHHACRAWLAWLVCTSVVLVASAQNNTTCPPASQCVYRILCIGDSLTKGSVPSKRINHPYSLRLQLLMNRKFKGRANPQITTAAYGGIGVFQKGIDDAGNPTNVTLLPLLRSQLAAARRRVSSSSGSSSSYRWVVIMDGITDLGAGNFTARAIMPRLIEAYNVSLQSGANVLAIPPLPNRFVAQSSRNELERRRLVAMITSWVNAQPNPTDCGLPRVYLLQPPPAWFNFWAMPAERLRQMQDDQVHLTQFGYDRLGQFVFDAISTRVPLRGCLCPV